MIGRCMSSPCAAKAYEYAVKRAGGERTDLDADAIAGGHGGRDEPRRFGCWDSASRRAPSLPPHRPPPPPARCIRAQNDQRSRQQSVPRTSGGLCAAGSDSFPLPEPNHVVEKQRLVQVCSFHSCPLTVRMIQLSGTSSRRPRTSPSTIVSLGRSFTSVSDT